MVNLIIGKKGTGKTKRLVDMVNAALQTSNGNVVCVEKGAILTYDINYNARLVDVENYGISGYDMLYGLVCGICAGNYDVTDLFIDATVRIGGDNFAELEAFVKKLDKIAADNNVKFTLAVSADASELPETLLSAVNKL